MSGALLPKLFSYTLAPEIFPAREKIRRLLRLISLGYSY
jgi:hypothetical protein